MRKALLSAAVGILLITSGSATGSGEENPVRNVEVQGKVICIDEARDEVPCADESMTFGFSALGGKRYFFMPDDVRAKMFQDQRVRERELVIKGWVRSRDQIEITKVWSVKNGQRFDIHYFCAVCNIKAHVGGLWWCFQADFELREAPID